MAEAKNLRKFLESDDPSMIMMGLSMAKGSGIPNELLGHIAGLYLWHDDKTVRAAAKSTFAKQAPEELKITLKENWSPKLRTTKTHEKLKPAIEKFAVAIKHTPLNVFKMWEIALFRKSGNRSAIAYGIKEMTDVVDSSTLLCKGLLGQLNRRPPMVVEQKILVASCRKIIIEIGKPSVPSLIECLDNAMLQQEIESPSVMLPSEVIRVLGEIGDKRAVVPLTKSLSLIDGAQARLIRIALGQIGDKKAITPVIESLKESLARRDRINGEIDHLVNFGNDIREPLIAMLDFSDTESEKEHFSLYRKQTESQGWHGEDFHFIRDVRQFAAKILYHLKHAGYKPETDEIRMKLMLALLTAASPYSIDAEDELISMGKKSFTFLIKKMKTSPDKEIYVQIPNLLSKMVLKFLEKNDLSNENIDNIWENLDN